MSGVVGAVDALLRTHEVRVPERLYQVDHLRHDVHRVLLDVVLQADDATGCESLELLREVAQNPLRVRLRIPPVVGVHVPDDGAIAHVGQHLSDSSVNVPCMCTPEGVRLMQGAQALTQQS